MARKSSPPGIAPRTRSIVERKDGTQLRRTTIYLPPELARRLKVHCAEKGYDMSAFVTQAVQRSLEDEA